MFEQIRQSVRRARQSSSDSEPSTPLKLQRTMAANASSPTPGQKTIDDIYGMLENMNKSNKETWSSMEKRLDKFELDMKRHIDSSVSSLRTDMNTEFKRVDDQIRQMQEQIRLLESAPPPPPAPNINLPRSELDTNRNLCFKNIIEDDAGDIVENLKRHVENILDSLNIASDVICVKRIGEIPAEPITGPFRQPRPRPAIVTFHSVEQKASVLKSKRNLRNNEQYKHIYIEPDKTRQERIMEANTRKIVQKLAGLKVRGGRVVNNN